MCIGNNIQAGRELCTHDPHVNFCMHDDIYVLCAISYLEVHSVQGLDHN